MTSLAATRRRFPRQLDGPCQLRWASRTPTRSWRRASDLESLDQEPLVVTGLASGRFELKIDGQSVGTFSDAELAKGVNLARYRTPMVWQAYAVK